MRRAPGLLIVAALAASLVACGGEEPAEPTAEDTAVDRLAEIHETCTETVQHPDALELGDDGHTLTADGYESYEDEAVWCVVDELDNDALLARMERTRPLDGVQSDEVDGLDIEWSAQVGDYGTRWVELLVTVAD